MNLRHLSVAMAATLLWATTGLAATIIDDFSGGVTELSHPNTPGPPVSGVWYDITSDAFAIPSAGTLDGSDAMQIDDGGFTNGVYALFDAVVPATGDYTVSTAMHVNETGGIDAIRAYQIGVIVNGVHRAANPSDLATVAGPGTAVGNYVGLTAGDDSGLATQIVTTGTFSASAGDSLVIAFSTDLDTGDFDSFSAPWGTSHVLVDNIMLNVAVPEPSTTLLWGLGCLIAAIVARRK